MSKNTELTVKDTGALEVPEETMGIEEMMEELDGLGSITLEQVKIPSGGGIAFEVPGDDPESPDIEKVLRGVIVHHQPKNVFFRNKFGEGEATSPDCSSADGKTGIMTISGAEKDCATCRYNQFGSGAGGSGKACQNRIDLYIMRDNSTFPIVLSLPATSIKAFKNYITSIVLKKKRLYQAVTEISLKKVKSAGGIDYATCVFKKAGEVPAEELHAMAEMRSLCKGLASVQRTVVNVDENTGELVDISEDPDEALPFN